MALTQTTWAIIFSVLAIIFIIWTNREEDSGACCDECSSANCSSDPYSSYSCCAANPVIKNQLEELQTGACSCIVNIGSMYLGASVASIRETITYNHPEGRLPESSFTNRPDLTLDPSKIIVGKNWHFSGDNGTLVVKLFYPSQISGFSVLHPRMCKLPTGHEVSAPKDFYVMGLEKLDDAEPFRFGNFTYDMGGPSAQRFPVQFCSKEKYQFIEFQFISNHGNPNYTSLYKVQIHGDSGPQSIPGHRGDVDKD